MKHRKIHLSSSAAAGAVLIACSLSAAAADRWWDGGTSDIGTAGDGASAGTAGTWDTSTLNWDQGATLAHGAWNNAANDTARFAGTAGTVTLATDITAAALNIAGAYIIDLGSNNLTLNGTGTTISANSAATLSGTGSVQLGSNQSWANSSGIMTVAAPVNTGANLLTLNTGNNNLDVTGKISGSGGLTINSTQTSGTAAGNSGNATLNNLNDYTGTTTVSGWIWLNSGGVSAFGPDPSNLIFNSGGVRLTGTGTIDRGITLSGTSGISKVSGTTTVNGKISGTGNLQISANFGTTSPVVLAAANDFTGDCVAGPDGIVRLAHANALAKANIAWSAGANRSTFDLSTANLAYVIGGLKGTNNNTGNLNLGTATANGGGGLVSIGANGQSNTYIGVISGAAGLAKIGTGTQTLIGTNTFTGRTVVEEGTLKLGHIAGQTLAGTTGSSATQRRITGLPSTIGLFIGQPVSGTGIAPGSVIMSIDSATQVTLSLNLTAINTATTADFGSATGSLASTTIEVRSGAFLDATALTSGMMLGTGGTLTGTGTVVGTIATVGTGSTITPGASPGTLTLGGLDLTNGGTFNFELGAASDLLDINGQLTGSSAGGMIFNLAGTAGIAGGMPYTLFTFDSSSGLDHTDLALGTNTTGLDLDPSFGNNGWRIQANSLQVQFVPEPSSLVLAALGLLTLRRRRHPN